MEDNFLLPSGEVVATEDSDTRLDAITQELMKQAMRSVAVHGEFHVVLSSSDLLDSAYCRLMYDPDLRPMPWEKTHIWFLQEQRDTLIDETIIMHSGIPENQVHRSRVETKIDDDPNFRLDCCVLELDDIPNCSSVMRNGCKVMLVLAENRDRLASIAEVGVSLQGDVYWFTEKIDLSLENP